MLVFFKGGKSENPEKNPWSKDENQQQTKKLKMNAKQKLSECAVII